MTNSSNNNSNTKNINFAELRTSGSEQIVTIYKEEEHRLKDQQKSQEQTSEATAKRSKRQTTGTSEPVNVHFIYSKNDYYR